MRALGVDSKMRLILRVSVMTIVVALASPGSGAGFWEGKPKLEAKLRDERAILVSARTEKGVKDHRADLFTIAGVGWVKRDAATVFVLAQQYDKLKAISDVFREVKFDPKTKRVFVICQALGYQARMLLSVAPHDIDASSAASSQFGKPAREIRFKVVDGHFLGLEGAMVFRELTAAERAGGSEQTEVSLRVHHEAREIPIPKILVGFALEVVVQKVAQKMRTHFEEAPPLASSSAPVTAPTK